MFRGIWIFGLNTSYLLWHPATITTVKFGDNGVIETEWKKLFSIKRLGFYIRK